MDRLKMLVKQVKQDMRNANVPFNDEISIIANKKLKTTAGRCHYRYSYELKQRVADFIDINYDMLINETDEFLKNVICHELIHSADECVNSGHTGIWVFYAKRMNDNNKNYYITRCYTKSDLSTAYAEKVYKYKTVCPNCGKEFYHRSRTKVIKSIEAGFKDYMCPKCNCDDLYVVKL